MKTFLLNLDRRIIFLFVFLGVAIPMLLPFHFPIKPTKNVRSVYDTIERIADSGGGTLLISFDYGPSSLPELQPMALSILRHSFRRNLKIVGMNHWTVAYSRTQNFTSGTNAKTETTPKVSKSCRKRTE